MGADQHAGKKTPTADVKMATLRLWFLGNRHRPRVWVGRWSDARASVSRRLLLFYLAREGILLGLGPGPSQPKQDTGLRSGGMAVKPGA